MSIASADNQAKITQFIEELKIYNEHTNIYSKKAYPKLAFHIQDSVVLAELIGSKPERILDMGSGSGLPSVILSIALPNSQITAVESKSRKTNFLTHIKDVLGLENLTIQTKDVQELIRKEALHPTVVTAKAFKPYQKVLKIVKKIPSNPRLFIPISQNQFHDVQSLKGDFKCIDKSPFYFLISG